MIPIRLAAVAKRYGDGPPVLAGIDVTVAPGELFFLLGPSGCGKSTLLRCIAGFLTPDSGSIWFGERDVTRLPPEQRETGMVFQSYALWPHLTVAQNVAFGLDVRKVAKAECQRRVGEALEQVGLSELAQRPIPQLSGGQQQRVALARALVIRPQVLLLDEPLSNLDAKLRLDMRTEIRRLCKAAHLTTVYVTHDQKEALSMADRMAVLHRGRLVQLGTPQEVYRRPVDRFVADFIGESNFVAGRVTRLSSGEAEIDTAWGHLHSTACQFAARPGDACVVSVRPECIRFTEQTGGPNRLQLTVAGGTYLGEMAQWLLAAGQDRLKAVELAPPPRAEGDAVICALAPDDVVVLPPEPPGATP